jgi:integrase
MGLGPAADVTLAEAREKALAARKLRLDGIDPLQARQQQKQAAIAERAKTVTFKAVAEAYLDLHLDSFRNEKHRQQWRSTLATYVYPKIGNMIVTDIGPADVLKCIEPIWNTKRETASRVRQRVERILDYATTRQYRTGDNPAAHVTESLPKGNNGRGHHAALPFNELPALMTELRERDSLSARALEFTILTAARTGETIGATRDEIDLKAKTWTIPAERMKAGKEHKVPLCSRAIEILQGLDQRTKNLFPLSNMAMAELLKGMRAGFTVHGMRSTFRDWAAETTNFPNHVIEMALAHTIGDKVEAAYRRGDLFTKRVKLMSAWQDFCGKPTVVSSGIVPFRKSC